MELLVADSTNVVRGVEVRALFGGVRR